MPNLMTALQRKFKHANGKIACRFLEDGVNEAASISYQGLNLKASVIAAYLQQKKLTQQRVVLFFPSGIEFITAFLGCLYAGVIAIPLFSAKQDFEKNKTLLHKILEETKAEAILTDNSFYGKIATDFADYRTLLINVQSLSDELASHYVLPKLKKTAISYLQYTSGSTNLPKAVIIRQQNLLTNIKSTSRAWQFTAKSCYLTLTPHSHVFGLVCGILLPLFRGGQLIVIPPQAIIEQPSRWLKAIDHYQVTHSGGPNFLYSLCIDYIHADDIEGVRLRSWLVAINGGEPVKEETIKRFAARFKPYGFDKNAFCSAYGMSEMSGTISVSSLGKIPRTFYLDKNALQNHKVKIVKKEGYSAFVTNGRILPDTEVVIVDPRTIKPLPKNRVGEIWVRGDSLMSGYWQGQSASRELMLARLPGSRKYFFRTGDLGFIRNKELCVTGRLKEIIVRYGKNFYAHDLEAVIKHAVSELRGGESLVFADPDRQDALIVLQEIESTAMLEHIKQNFIDSIRKALLDSFGLSASAIYLVAERGLPRTISGKLQRKLAQQLFMAKQLAIVNQHTVNEPLTHQNDSDNIKGMELPFWNELAADIKNILASTLSIHVSQINLNSPLSVYGLDSLTIIQFTNAINQHFALSLIPSDLYNYLTLGHFIAAAANTYQDYFLNHYEAHERVPSIQISTVHSEQHKRAAVRSQDMAIIGMHGIFPGAKDLSTFWVTLSVIA